MKTKHVWLGVSAVILAGGLWFARAAWRAHHQIVTLHLRNAPLAEVLRKLERQTWKKIRAEQALDARITLNVVNKPLTYVLDRLAEQAGAQWSTLYAVYDSSGALNNLQAALHGDGRLEPAGWAKIAPQAPQLKDRGELRYLPEPGANLEVKKLPPDFVPGGVATATEDSSIENTATGKVKTGVSGPGVVSLVPRALHVVRKGSNDGTVEEEIWSPEELVVETSLKTRLGNEPPPDEIPVAAVQMAQKLKAHWTTYVAFRKSVLGIGFGGHHRFMRGGPDPQLNGTNVENLQGLPPDFEEAAKQEPNNLFERLTPEQRVRRARQLSAPTKIENQNSNESK